MLDSYTWQDLYSDIEATQMREHLVPLISTALEKLGFAYWAYGVKPRLTLDCSKVETIDAYPFGWMAHYRQAGYLRIDSTIGLAASSNSTISWSDAMTPDSAALWADARDFGLKVGVARSSWDRTGSLGLFSLARESGSVSTSELKQISPNLTWISALLHSKIMTCESRKASRSIEMSEREIEILRWTAMGKTAPEISSIIGITTRTVNFHVGNILMKLDAQNKIQAAVRGLNLGLI